MRTLFAFIISLMLSATAGSAELPRLNADETFSFISHLAPQLLLDAEELKPLLNPEPILWDKNPPQENGLEGAVLYGRQRLEDGAGQAPAEL